MSDDNRILDAEEVATAGLVDAYALGLPTLRELRDSHEALRAALVSTEEALEITRGQHWSLQKALGRAEAALVTATTERDALRRGDALAWAQAIDRAEAAEARVAVLEAALRTLIEDYYVEETYPATVKAARALLVGEPEESR